MVANTWHALSMLHNLTLRRTEIPPLESITKTGSPQTQKGSLCPSSMHNQKHAMLRMQATVCTCTQSSCCMYTTTAHTILAEACNLKQKFRYISLCLVVDHKKLRSLIEVIFVCLDKWYWITIINHTQSIIFHHRRLDHIAYLHACIAYYCLYTCIQYLCRYPKLESQSTIIIQCYLTLIPHTAQQHMQGSCVPRVDDINYMEVLVCKYMLYDPQPPQLIYQ